MAPRRPSRRAKGAAPPPPRGLSPEDDAAATPAHSLRPVKAEGGVGPGGAGAAVLATHRHRSPASATTPAAPLQAPGTPQTSPRHTLLGTAHLVRRPPPRAATTIDDLPDELLLKVSETGRRGAREGGGELAFTPLRARPPMHAACVHAVGHALDGSGCRWNGAGPSRARARLQQHKKAMLSTECCCWPSERGAAPRPAPPAPPTPTASGVSMGWPRRP